MIVGLAHEIDCELNQKDGGNACTCWFGFRRGQTQFPARTIDPSARIHPSVKIGKGVRIGVGVVIAEGVVIEDGVSIWHHANILPNAHIKKDAMVAFCCQIERDVVIGERSRIQPFAAPGSGTVVGSDVYFGPYSCSANAPYPPCKRLQGGVIGDGAIIGMGVYIFPGVKVGKRAVVGTGSLVRHDIPDEEVWFGRPCAYATTRKAYDDKQAVWESGKMELDTRIKNRLEHGINGVEEEPRW